MLKEKQAIATQVSTKELKFQPGGAPACFDVTVTNRSDRLATFQVELLAAGATTGADNKWYSLSPEISTKIPPGDSTKFSIQAIDNPKPGFVGAMNLTVRAFSLELRQEDRQSLRLILEVGKAAVPVKVNLPTRNFQVSPAELVEIPVQLYNPGQLLAEVVLRCTGLDPAWLVEGAEKRLRLSPGGRSETNFFCQIPPPAQAPSRTYPFAVEATLLNGPLSKAEGKLKIEPAGFVEFSCTPIQQKIPELRGWLPNWKANTATYQLQFQNQSNLSQQVTAKVKPGEDQPKCTWQIVPDRADLDREATTQLNLVVSKQHRRWLGFAQKCLFEVKAVLPDSRLDVRNDTQIVKLRIQPVIPLWMQVTGLALVLFLTWWLSGLNPDSPLIAGHTAPVNSVQFNGVGDKVVSGSADQSAIKWRVDGFFNPIINQNAGAIAKKIGKFVRVVRYRPANNDLVALGLENGEIQLWSAIDEGEKLQQFSDRKADRVLDLAFTKDSRYLLSGHGSGMVLQWDLTTPAPTKLRQQQVGFAVYALALVGSADSYLAIAGRFNQLVFWNLKNNTLRRPLTANSGSAEDYIFSLATAAQKPYLLATANNQGEIAIWNLQPCLTGSAACELVDKWTPNRSPVVRSVALTADGCYLASAGRDGRAILWALKAGGQRLPDSSSDRCQGSACWVLERSPHSLNTVDVFRFSDRILVASGNDDGHVKVKRHWLNSGFWFNKLPQPGCN